MKRSILSDNFLPQICCSLFNAVSTRRVLKKAREFCRVCFNFPAQWLRLVLFLSECQNKGSAFNFRVLLLIYVIFKAFGFSY